MVDLSWATGIGILPLTFLMVASATACGRRGDLWPWLPMAAAAGWLLWWALAVRRRDKNGSRVGE